MSSRIDVPGMDDSDMGDMDDLPLATPYDPSSAGVTGFLIDLDGTMYDPAGLLPGASAFDHWALAGGERHPARVPVEHGREERGVGAA